MKKVPKDKNIQRVYQEIFLHKTLTHPTVIEFVDYFEDTDNVYIVMEYAAKGDLFNFMKTN